MEAICGVETHDSDGIRQSPLADARQPRQESNIRCGRTTLGPTS
jgi:hypothetical protein